jgi:hypothetical protein
MLALNPLTEIPSESSAELTDKFVMLVTIGNTPTVVQLSLSGVLNSVVFQNPSNATTNQGIPYTIGGLQAGTVIKDLPLTNILQTMLFPNPVPSITSFTCDIPLNYMCGESTDIASVFSWTLDRSDLLDADEGTIYDATENVALDTYTPSTDTSKEVSLGEFGMTQAAPGTVVIENRISYNSGTISKSITLTWSWPTVSISDTGSAAPISSELVTMNRIWGASRDHTITLHESDTRVVLAYPQDTGAPKAIIHVASGTNVKPAFDISTVTVTRNGSSKDYTVLTYLPSIVLGASELLVQF